MVKTREGGSQTDHICLIVLVRRREWGGASNIVEGDKGEENVVVENVKKMW